MADYFYIQNSLANGKGNILLLHSKMQSSFTYGYPHSDLRVQ